MSPCKGSTWHLNETEEERVTGQFANIGVPCQALLAKSATMTGRLIQTEIWATLCIPCYISLIQKLPWSSCKFQTIDVSLREIVALVFFRKHYSAFFIHREGMDLILETTESFVIEFCTKYALYLKVVCVCLCMTVCLSVYMLCKKWYRSHMSLGRWWEMFFYVFLLSQRLRI